jgi:hypothetical protein
MRYALCTLRIMCALRHASSLSISAFDSAELVAGRIPNSEFKRPHAIRGTDY